MTTTTQTTRQALETAGADLTRQGITLVLSAGPKTTGDAWCDATEKHGERIALIHLPDGTWRGGPRYHSPDNPVPASTLYVSYPWDDVDVGVVIYRILAAHGFDLDWDGDPTDAIQIHL